MCRKNEKTSARRKRQNSNKKVKKPGASFGEQPTSYQVTGLGLGSLQKSLLLMSKLNEIKAGETNPDKSHGHGVTCNEQARLIHDFANLGALVCLLILTLQNFYWTAY